MTTWNSRLKLAMTLRGRDPSELARAAGVKQPSVSEWLSGETRMMGAENAIKVCAFLDIPQEWLFMGIGSIDIVKNDTHKRKLANRLLSDLPDYAIDEAIKRINDIKEFAETVKKNSNSSQ